VPRVRKSLIGTVIGGLLPIILTLALGFFAGWHHDLEPEQASVLNRIALLYAPPHRWCWR
jgi:malonate transporter and related proteins